jgi:hypothetical protein
MRGFQFLDDKVAYPQNRRRELKFFDFENQRIRAANKGSTAW